MDDAVPTRLRRLDPRGVIEEGMLADIVILDSDPPIDIRNTRAISRVIEDGCVVDRCRYAGRWRPNKRVRH